MTNLTIPAEEAKGTINLEPGVYRATVQSIETADGQFGEQCKFAFELDGLTQEDGSPASLWAWASWKLNPSTKLHRWVLALGGPRPVPGQQYQLGQLVGKPCRLMVETRVTDDGDRPKVAEVMPVQKAGARTMKPTAEAACSQCGEPVEVYGPDGTAYCQTHAPQGA